MKGGVDVLQGSDLGVRKDGGRKVHVGLFGTPCIGGQAWGVVQVFLRRSCKSQVWIRCHRRVGRGREGSRGQRPGTIIYQISKHEASAKRGEKAQVGRQVGSRGE